MRDVEEVPWRDGARELRRLVEAEGADPDRIPDAGLAWRAFRAFLTLPLGGLFDRWDSDDAEADELLIDFGVTGWSGERPGLLFIRRFHVPAVDWHDGVPGEPPEADDDLDLADTVQIELELTYAAGTTADADDFWTATRSGDFAAADLAEAGELVATLGLGPALHSRVGLVNPN